jgi:hypothetical protein
MTTITNNSGSKKVNISKNQNSIIANYVQLYCGMEQVLQSKSFASVKNAEKWANKILN